MIIYLKDSCFYSHVSVLQNSDEALSDKLSDARIKSFMHLVSLEVCVLLGAPSLWTYFHREVISDLHVPHISC